MQNNFSIRSQFAGGSSNFFVVRLFLIFASLGVFAYLLGDANHSMAEEISKTTPTTALSASQANPPNIIFIMADDLGYGDLGCYGQKNIKTPRLDQLAEGGMRFTDFYSGSTVCAPSRCSLMTGYHTGRCFIRGNSRQSLRDEDVTIPEVLHDMGYQNGICGKWGLGEEGTSGVPLLQGFDYFYGYLNQRHAHNYYPSFLYENDERIELANVVPDEDEFGAGTASEKIDYSHTLVVEKALDFIQDNQDDQFFLYLSLTIPHANNEAKNKGMEVPDYGQYANKDWPDPQKGHAAMISLMDQDVGRVVDLLDELGIRENTVVFFTSDNGPHSEGGYKPEMNDSNGPLKKQKRSLHEGGIRVPLIVNWPGAIKAGSTSKLVSAFWDVMPTLADVTGESLDLPKDISGISFYHELVGDTHLQKQHDFLYWAFFEQGGARAMREGNWKIIQQPFHSPARLYDLERDIGEIRDVSNLNKEIVANLKKIMDRQYSRSEKWRFMTEDEWLAKQRENNSEEKRKNIK